jgi:hypothetical protein
MHRTQTALKLFPSIQHKFFQIFLIRIGGISHYEGMPFLSTDLYIESESGLSVEQIAVLHSIRPQEVEDRIEAARLFFEVQLLQRDFPFELLGGPFAERPDQNVEH